MNIISKLSTVEENETILTDVLQHNMYVSILNSLAVPDISLILAALDLLYFLSNLNEICAVHICKVHGSIDMLISLVTVRAESYGNRAILGFRIVENKHSIFTQRNQALLKTQQGKMQQVSQGITMQMPAPGLMAKKRVSLPNLPSRADILPVSSSVSMAQSEANSTQVSSSNAIIASPGTPKPSSDASEEVLIEMDGEMFAAHWMSAYYEPNTEGAMILLGAVYADYLQTCQRLERVGVLPPIIFHNVLKAVLPPHLAQIVPSAADGQPNVCGIQRRVQPMPVHSNVPVSIANQILRNKPSGGLAVMHSHHNYSPIVSTPNTPKQKMKPKQKRGSKNKGDAFAHLKSPCGRFVAGTPVTLNKLAAQDPEMFNEESNNSNNSKQLDFPHGAPSSVSVPSLQMNQMSHMMSILNNEQNAPFPTSNSLNVMQQLQTFRPAAPFGSAASMTGFTSNANHIPSAGSLPIIPGAPTITNINPAGLTSPKSKYPSEVTMSMHSILPFGLVISQPQRNDNKQTSLTSTASHLAISGLPQAPVRPQQVQPGSQMTLQRPPMAQPGPQSSLVGPQLALQRPQMAPSRPQQLPQGPQLTQSASQQALIRSPMAPLGLKQTGPQSAPPRPQSAPLGPQQLPQGPQQATQGSQQITQGSQQVMQGLQMASPKPQQMPQDLQKMPPGPPQAPSLQQQIPLGLPQRPIGPKHVLLGPQQAPSGSQLQSSAPQQMPSGAQQMPSLQQIPSGIQQAPSGSSQIPPGLQQAPSIAQQQQQQQQQQQALQGPLTLQSSQATEPSLMSPKSYSSTGGSSNVSNTSASVAKPINSPIPSPTQRTDQNAQIPSSPQAFMQQQQQPSLQSMLYPSPNGHLTTLSNQPKPPSMVTSPQPELKKPQSTEKAFLAANQSPPSDMALHMNGSLPNTSIDSNTIASMDNKTVIEQLKLEMQSHFVQFHLHRQHIQIIQLQVQQIMQKTKVDQVPTTVIQEIQVRVSSHHQKMILHYQRLQQLTVTCERLQKETKKAEPEAPVSPAVISTPPLVSPNKLTMASTSMHSPSFRMHSPKQPSQFSFMKKDSIESAKKLWSQTPAVQSILQPNRMQSAVSPKQATAGVTRFPSPSQIANAGKKDLGAKKSTNVFKSLHIEPSVNDRKKGDSKKLVPMMKNQQGAASPGFVRQNESATVNKSPLSKNISQINNENRMLFASQAHKALSPTLKLNQRSELNLSEHIQGESPTNTPAAASPLAKASPLLSHIQGSFMDLLSSDLPAPPRDASASIQGTPNSMAGQNPPVCQPGPLQTDATGIVASMNNSGVLLQQHQQQQLIQQQQQLMHQQQQQQKQFQQSLESSTPLARPPPPPYNDKIHLQKSASN